MSRVPPVANAPVAPAPGDVAVRPAPAAGAVHLPPAKSPLSSADTWDLVAEAYAAEALPMFEFFATEALQLAAVPAEARVLDVAAGPGTLALKAAAKGAKVTALDFSPQMIEQLQERATRANLAIETQIGDGQRLMFASDHFDRAFSLFGLMFFPDRGAGFRDLYRVLVPGGRVVVSSWAPFQGVYADLMQSLRANLPGMPPAGTMPLSDPQGFVVELAAAGFAEVKIHTVSHAVKAPSVEALWGMMQRTNPPIALVRRTTGDKDWAPIAAAVQADLERKYGKGPVEDQATAHLGTGIKGD